MLALQWEDLPGEVRARSKRCLKDVIAAAADFGQSALPAGACDVVDRPRRRPRAR